LCLGQGSFFFSPFFGLVLLLDVLLVCVSLGKSGGVSGCFLRQEEGRLLLRSVFEHFEGVHSAMHAQHLGQGRVVAQFVVLEGVPILQVHPCEDEALPPNWDFLPLG
jgi:hypothetical protein